MDRVTAGISLEGPWAWEVQPPKDNAAFVRQLAHLFTEDMVIYLEGAGAPADVGEILTSRTAENPATVRCGTIWPKPAIFHLAATAENIEILAQLFGKYEAWKLCDHLHVYRGETVYLEWYDAFGKDPLLLSERLNDEQVARFAEALDCQYEKVPFSGPHS